MEEKSLHVVLGAGQVGPLVVDCLLARGARVRVVRRSSKPIAARPGVELVAADVRDPEAAAQAMRGASVVYNCTNPRYDEWPTMLPALARGILAGAARNNARLVVLDNLYMYGDTACMNEESALTPRSKKGALRAENQRTLLGAHERGEVRVAIARAADFFGPGVTDQSAFGELFFKRVLKGRSAMCLGNPDSVHSYSFVPDVAAGLVAIGEREDVFGNVWMLPVPPAETTRAVIARFGRELGANLGVTAIPQFVLRTAGVFNSIIRETAEMTYQFRQPFVVDDARFRATFGWGATSWDEAIAASVAWGRARYGSVAAPSVEPTRLARSA